MARERELTLSMEALYALLRKVGLAGTDETVRGMRIVSDKLVIEIVR